MKRLTIISVATSIALVSYIFSVSFAQSNNGSIPVIQPLIGRYTLTVVKKEMGVTQKYTENILYRIDTITGKVDVFDPTSYYLASKEHIEKQSKEQQEEVDRIKKTQPNVSVLENDCWRPISETCDGITFKILPK